MRVRAAPLYLLGWFALAMSFSVYRDNAIVASVHVGYATILLGLPYPGLLLLGGLLAQLFDRRRLLAILYGSSALVGLLLASSAMVAPVFGLAAALYLILIAVGTYPLGAVARMMFLADLVPRRSLVPWVAVAVVVTTGAYVLGTTFGDELLSGRGVGGFFAAPAAGAVFTVALVMARPGFARAGRAEPWGAGALPRGRALAWLAVLALLAGYQENAMLEAILRLPKDAVEGLTGGGWRAR